MPAPSLLDRQIVFHCPAGHRLVVPAAVAGKHGTCSKCGVGVRIPVLESPSGVDPSPAPPAVDVPAEPPASTIGEPAAAATTGPVADGGGDWTFIAGIEGEPSPGAGAWTGSAATVPAATANPMARLLERLWQERDHGGIVELHLVGGAVLLPEEFSARWSGGSHGLFASQAADGSVTLTAVAWETVQRIVVRQLTAVPDDVFD